MKRFITWRKALIGGAVLLTLAGAGLNSLPLSLAAGSPGPGTVAAVYADGDSCDNNPPPPFLDCPPTPTATPTPPGW